MLGLLCTEPKNHYMTSHHPANWIGGSESFADHLDVSHAARIAAPLVQTFAAMTIDEVIQRLEEVQIANARVNEMKDVWAPPQLQARDRWREVGSPAARAVAACLQQRIYAAHGCSP